MSFLTDEEELAFSELAEPILSGPTLNDLLEIKVGLRELLHDLNEWRIIISLIFSLVTLCSMLAYVMNR